MVTTTNLTSAFAFSWEIQDALSSPSTWLLHLLLQTEVESAFDTFSYIEKLTGLHVFSKLHHSLNLAVFYKVKSAGVDQWVPFKSAFYLLTVLDL